MLNLNLSYLNKTPNKAPRPAGTRSDIQGVIWHETASPNPTNPYGTLDYNLNPALESSYNYLIARDGTIFHYVDEEPWIAWHAGVKSSALGYSQYQVNVHTIGVELDGRNNGDPITLKQRDSAVQLALYFKAEYGIPLDVANHITHKAAAPGYKSDPRGYSPTALLTLAQQAPAAPVDVQVIGGPQIVTRDAFLRATARNDTTPWLSAEEWRRFYVHCEEFQVDAAYCFAVALSEAGRGPFGSNPLYHATRNAGNIKAASCELAEFEGKRPIYKDEQGRYWRKYQSGQLGMFALCDELKNTYGWHLGLTTIRAITAIRSPSSDGNDVERLCRTLIGDIEYMRTH